MILFLFILASISPFCLSIAAAASRPCMLISRSKFIVCLRASALPMHALCETSISEPAVIQPYWQLGEKLIIPVNGDRN